MPLRQALFGGLFLCLSACSVISHEPPPPDFPKLEIKVFEVDYLYRYCPHFQAIGCAQIHWAKNLCAIFVGRASAPIRNFIVSHEEEHCRGKDHVGSTSLRDAWERWKELGNVVGSK